MKTGEEFDATIDALVRQLLRDVGPDMAFAALTKMFMCRMDGLEQAIRSDCAVGIAREALQLVICHKAIQIVAPLVVPCGQETVQ